MTTHSLPFREFLHARRVLDACFSATWIARAALCLLLCLPLPAARGQGGAPAAPAPTPNAAPAAVAVPAARAAKNPFVITIKGEIDEWTARSVVRRLKEAELAGADAIIFEIDTPGGEMGAMLVISGAIKKCPIKTVAWVNSNAYSAGSVIALACGEIVVSDSAALGDALPIEVAKILQGMSTPDREAEKFIGPVMADVIDSARKNGRDEVLVQGFVRRGVELWLIEHTQTGQRFFVTADEYALAVGSAPYRGTPTVASATGPMSGRNGTPPSGMPTPEKDGTPAVRTGDSERSDTGFIPGAPNVSADLKKEVDQELSIRGRVTARPDFRGPDHAGKYRVVEYVSDGHGPLTFRDPELLRYQIATQKVRSDTELQGYFGAAKLTKLDESWSEKLARVLTMLPVRGILIVIFLIALFIEMVHPGLVLPGVCAGLALLALVVPPMLVNMSAWWTLAAVLSGIALIGVEIFLVPGTLVAGILGVLLVFVGLVGAVVGGSASAFSGPGNDGLYAVATVMLSLIVAGGGMWVVSRYLHSVPVVNRLVLRDDADEMAGTLAASAGQAGQVAVGSTGKAITPLRPAGRAQFGDEIVDVVADLGFVDAGESVRVTASDRFRIVVERVAERGAQERA